MKQLDTVKEVLKNTLSGNTISPDLYSLDGYREEAFCFEQTEEGKFLVYVGERENKEDKVEYENLFNACIDLISRVSSSNKEEEKIRRQFAEDLVRVLL